MYSLAKGERERFVVSPPPLQMQDCVPKSRSEEEEERLSKLFVHVRLLQSQVHTHSNLGLNNRFSSRVKWRPATLAPTVNRTTSVSYDSSILCASLANIANFSSSPPALPTKQESNFKTFLVCV